MEAGPAYWQALNDHAFAYDSTVSEYWGGGGSPSASKRAWPYKLSSGFKTNCAWFGGLHCSGTYPKLVEVSLPLLQVRAPTGGAVAGGESLHASCARRWQLTAPRARLFPPRPPPYHGCCAVKEGLWWVVHWADGPQGCLQQLEVSVRGMGGGRAGLCAPLCRQWCSDARVRAARLPPAAAPKTHARAPNRNPPPPPRREFDARYGGNRAPMGVYIHATATGWMTTANAAQAARFLQYAAGFKGGWMGG